MDPVTERKLSLVNAKRASSFLLRRIEFFPKDYLIEKKIKGDASLPILADLIEILDHGEMAQYNYYRQWAKDLLIQWTEVISDSKHFSQKDNGLAVVIYLVVIDILQTTDCKSVDDICVELNKRFSFDRYHEDGWMSLLLPEKNRADKIKKPVQRKYEVVIAAQILFIKDMIKSAFDSNLQFELLRQSTNEEFYWNQYYLCEEMHVPKKNYARKIPKSLSTVNLALMQDSNEDGTIAANAIDDSEHMQKLCILPLEMSSTVDEDFWNFLFKNYIETIKESADEESIFEEEITENVNKEKKGRKSSKNNGRK